MKYLVAATICALLACATVPVQGREYQVTWMEHGHPTLSLHAHLVDKSDSGWIFRDDAGTQITIPIWQTEHGQVVIRPWEP